MYFSTNLTPLLLSASGEKCICTEPYSLISALSTAMKIFLTEPYFSVLRTNYGNEYISNQTLLLYASEKNVVLTEPYSSTPLYYGEEYIHNGTILH